MFGLNFRGAPQGQPCLEFGKANCARFCLSFLPTVEAFARVAQEAPQAARVWLRAMQGVTREEIGAMIREVPPDRMSEVTRRFTLELILVNQQRLLAT